MDTNKQIYKYKYTKTTGQLAEVNLTWSKRDDDGYKYTNTAQRDDACFNVLGNP